MCYTFTAYKAEDLTDLLFEVIHNNTGFNRDGYGAIWCKDEVKVDLVKSMKLHDYFKQLYMNFEEIKKSRYFAIHLRAATHGTVDERNVHLWNFGGYYCAHNGILDCSTASDSDSYVFFRNIEEDLFNEDYKGIKKKIEERSGYGVFLMTNVAKDRIITISYGKTLYEYRDGEALILSSADAIKGLETKEHDDCLLVYEKGKLVNKLELDRADYSLVYGGCSVKHVGSNYVGNNYLFEGGTTLNKTVIRQLIRDLYGKAVLHKFEELFKKLKKYNLTMNEKLNLVITKMLQDGDLDDAFINDLYVEEGDTYVEVLGNEYPYDDSKEAGKILYRSVWEKP